MPYRELSSRGFKGAPPAELRRDLSGVTAWRAAVAALLLVISCGTSAGSGPMIHVENLDGPTARVVAWDGGPSVTVACGGSRTVGPQGAPSLPWHLTVYDASSGRVLFSHTVTGTIYLIIRSDRVLWGDQPGNGGPVPGGCH